MSKSCPICNTRAKATNEFCQQHKLTWEVREFSIFGKFLGWGLFTDKIQNGTMPTFLGKTEQEANDFFWNNILQLKDYIDNQVVFYQRQS